MGKNSTSPFPERMKFRNEYAFLSNFAAAPVKVRGVLYPTVEHAFQACKTLDLDARARILACGTPGEAKGLGRRVPLRPDWDEVKEEVMLALLRVKFARSPLKEKLIAVSGEIVEENDWNDRYWGKCKGVGQNRLGVLLMQVRAELMN